MTSDRGCSADDSGRCSETLIDRFIPDADGNNVGPVAVHGRNEGAGFTASAAEIVNTEEQFETASRGRHGSKDILNLVAVRAVKSDTLESLTVNSLKIGLNVGNGFASSRGGIW